MDTRVTTIHDRLGILGLQCEDVPTDRLTSATMALSCFPMYMVSNSYAWADPSKTRETKSDWPGFADTIREAFAIGEQEADLELNSNHTKSIHTLLGAIRPADLIIFEYALCSMGWPVKLRMRPGNSGKDIDPAGTTARLLNASSKRASLHQKHSL